ncbi:Unknown protein [Striga hermonthica]|uniref:Uncharacterized protein n=1 Tax=Striga hermonthica TaxID=68872 RepID=A0A9N7N5M9_STRHE|nr:Unknown protein [Striga hermonthica]
MASPTGKPNKICPELFFLYPSTFSSETRNFRQKMVINSLRRTLLRALRPPPSSSSVQARQSYILLSLSNHSQETSTSAPFPRPNFTCTGVVCRRLSSLSEMESLGPAAIDYR